MDEASSHAMLSLEEQQKHKDLGFSGVADQISVAPDLEYPTTINQSGGNHGCSSFQNAWFQLFSFPHSDANQCSGAAKQGFF